MINRNFTDLDEKSQNEWLLMKAGAKQELLALSIPLLIGFAFIRGYTVRIGEVHRARPLPHGHPESLHHDKLAIDIHLCQDGKYLTDSEDHRFLGEFWETLSPIHHWGGYFDSPDGNHYSITHRGMR